MDGRKGVLGSENGMCGGRGEVKSMIHSGKGKQLSVMEKRKEEG